MFQLSEINLNPSNPRFIKDDKFKKLCASIKEFPEMMALRPIIIDENGMNLGGNMRYKALIELGYKEVPNEWVKRVKDLTEKQKSEFIIKDNVGFGEWDWDKLANEWDEVKLQEWGLDLPVFGETENETDLSDKFQSEFKIELECESEREQEKLFNEFQKKGYKCRILTL